MSADELVEFLTARIDKDHERALGGGEAPHYPHLGDTAFDECAAMASNEGCSDLGVACIQHFSLSRLLAEVEAKRAILRLHGDQHECADGDVRTYGWPVLGCETLRLLAMPYASHPDYRDEWR